LFLRANLAPTFSLSLGRVGLRAISGTLRTKIDALTSLMSHGIEGQLHSIETNELDLSSITTSAAPRIWIHAQKVLLAKQFPGTIQPFCAPHSGHVDVDDILEEQWVQREEATFQTTLPLQVSTTPSSLYEKLLGDHITGPEEGYVRKGTPDDDELLFDYT
jgi:hypothetical protein